MLSTQVMRQENKCILKILDRLKKISIEAHYTQVLREDEIENGIEFINMYIKEYQHIKQEKILFNEVICSVGKEVKPSLHRIMVLHGRCDKYLEQMESAYRLYKKGRFLALYDLILSAISYAQTKEKSILEEERLYLYIERRVPLAYQKRIDIRIANFHGRLMKQQYIPLDKASSL